MATQIKRRGVLTSELASIHVKFSLLSDGNNPAFLDISNKLVSAFSPFLPISTVISFTYILINFVIISFDWPLL